MMYLYPLHAARIATKMALFIGLVLAGLIANVGAEEFPTFTDTSKAGPDFLVQGEYVGLVGGSHAIAAQVIAMGEGKFEGVLFGGGLPGAGWDETTRFHFRGETKDGVTRFIGLHGERLKYENTTFTGLLQEGNFKGTADMFRNVVDVSSFEMKKVDRKSSTLGARPPKGAIVLFDGSSTNEWIDGKFVDDKLLDNGATSKRLFQGIQLHVEFRLPFMPTAQGMNRGNSGLYVKDWEIQIGDTFGWTSENRQFERLSLQGLCGSLMKMAVPRLNMCFPPLAWQTLDVDFEAAEFDSKGHKQKPAMMTVRHNGVMVFDRYVMSTVPPGGSPDRSVEKDARPILLQAHGNPVHFRNIWVREKK